MTATSGVPLNRRAAVARVRAINADASASPDVARPYIVQTTVSALPCVIRR